MRFQSCTKIFIKYRESQNNLVAMTNDKCIYCNSPYSHQDEEYIMCLRCNYSIGGGIEGTFIYVWYRDTLSIVLFCNSFIFLLC